jgi:hypothetical protein
VLGVVLLSVCLVTWCLLMTVSDRWLLEAGAPRCMQISRTVLLSLSVVYWRCFSLLVIGDSLKLYLLSSHFNVIMLSLIENFLNYVI